MHHTVPLAHGSPVYHTHKLQYELIIESFAVLLASPIVVLPARAHLSSREAVPLGAPKRRVALVLALLEHSLALRRWGVTSRGGVRAGLLAGGARRVCPHGATVIVRCGAAHRSRGNGPAGDVLGVLERVGHRFLLALLLEPRLAVGIDLPLSKDIRAGTVYQS
jgi:hypothetical protein